MGSASTAWPSASMITMPFFIRRTSDRKGFLYHQTRASSLGGDSAGCGRPVRIHRVGGGSRLPPPPTERSVQISCTTLFGRGFTAPCLLFVRVLFPWSAVHLFA